MIRPIVRKPAVRVLSLVFVLMFISGCSMLGADREPAGQVSGSVTPTPAPASKTPNAKQSAEAARKADYRAVEKAYRAGITEVNRLAAKGGTKKSTKKFDAVATGAYRTDLLNDLKDQKESDYRYVNSAIRIGWIKPEAHNGRIVTLLACEDTSALEYEYQNDTFSMGDVILIKVYAMREGGRWKLSNYQTAGGVASCGYLDR